MTQLRHKESHWGLEGACHGIESHVDDLPDGGEGWEEEGVGGQVGDEVVRWGMRCIRFNLMKKKQHLRAYMLDLRDTLCPLLSNLIGHRILMKWLVTTAKMV